MTVFHIGKYEIDPVLFEKGFAKECGPFRCESKCCSVGVYVDLKERGKILSYKETIKRYMDETQTADDSRWFDSEIEDDPDYPSGKAVGTEIFGGKCVFLTKEGRCSLQIMGIEEGFGEWALKPFYCIAFPITIENGVVTFDDFQQDNTRCCSVVESTADGSTPLVDSCKAELEFVLGEDGYRQLSEIRSRSTVVGGMAMRSMEEDDI
ncbi:MAG: DUF3109 family protein [Bacteroidota bacterium]|nr:DUF3109 family protein [Bacteroidota bacterium]